MLPTISGEFRLGGDPELRYTPNGAAVCNVRAVATSRRKNPQTDQWEDDKQTWVTLQAWNKSAENIAESLSKGDLVSVVGKLHVEEWEDNDGNKRITPKILIDAIGPSLSFATAKVTKAQRSGGQQTDPWAGANSAQAPAEDPWNTSPQSDEPPF